jgi:hypothetical protein
MTTHEDGLPVPADGRDLVDVGPVCEAELVEETKPIYYQPRWAGSGPGGCGRAECQPG